jgi:phosphohistidine phosphatase
MLWLLRHAEAAEGAPDHERPLTRRGREEAQAAGRALSRLGARLELCLSSPRVRAEETARLACEALDIEIRLEPALSGEPFDIAELTAGLEHVLLVGHDPSFSMTLHDVTGAQARMAKGGLAAIKQGELVVLMRPLEIAAIAGAAKGAR